MSNAKTHVLQKTLQPIIMPNTLDLLNVEFGSLQYDKTSGRFREMFPHFDWKIYNFLAFNGPKHIYSHTQLYIQFYANMPSFQKFWISSCNQLKSQILLRYYIKFMKNSSYPKNLTWLMESENENNSKWNLSDRHNYILWNKSTFHKLFTYLEQVWFCKLNLTGRYFKNLFPLEMISKEITTQYQVVSTFQDRI